MYASVILAVAALALWPVGRASAAPVRPLPKPEPPPASVETWPDLAGQTNWGLLKQDGAHFTITGHEHWEAVGRIDKDRATVYIQWTLNADGRVAPSVYKYDAATYLVGEWGWLGEVTILPTGAIVGDVRTDRMRRVTGGGD